jgi:hypothetical protein
MSTGPFHAEKILPCLVVLGGVLGLLAMPLNHAVPQFQQLQSTTTSTTCAVSVESGLTVEVVNSSNIPVSNAIVLLNGTYTCGGQIYPSNFSGTTDSHGSAVFSVVPYARYSVTVIPPRSLTGAKVVVSVVTAPPPTMFATTTVTVAESPVAPAMVLIAAILLATVIISKGLAHVRSTLPSSAITNSGNCRHSSEPAPEREAYTGYSGGQRDTAQR